MHTRERAAAICVAIGLVAMPGCIRPSLVECGELACAPAQVCHQNRCLDPSQLAGCEPPIEDGATCDALGELGHCTVGVCEAATCGDGFVDAELHEACDDSVPATHCIDVGFDLGRPSCTACQVDTTAGCTRFGWERVVDAATTFMWTDGTTMAYLTVAPPALEVHAPGSDVVVPGAFFGVFGAANGRVVAWNSSSAVEVANGTMRFLPTLPTSMTHVRMDDNGVIYALAGCTVHAIARDAVAWSVLAVMAGPSCGRIEVGPVVNGRPRILASRGDPTATELWEYNPTSAQFELLRVIGTTIANMRIQPTAGGDILWVSTGHAFNVFRIENGVLGPLAVGFPATTIVFAAGDVYFGDTVGNVARLRGERVARFRSPTGGLVFTGGDRLYAYRGSIHRFTGVTRGTRSPIVPPSPIEIVASLVEPDGTIVAISRSQIHTPNPDGGSWTHTNVPGVVARAIAGAAPTYFISSFDDTRQSPQVLRSTTGLSGPWSSVAIPGSPLIHGLSQARDGTLVAVGEDDAAGSAVFAVLRGATWTMHSIADCTAHAASAIHASHAIAVGACGEDPVVWSYDGAQWQEMTRPALSGPLDAVVAVDNSVFAAGTGGATWFDGASWHIDREAVGQRLSATSRTDVWLSGEFTTIQRFDGAVWSKLATSASGPISVAASPDRVLFPGATADFVELVR